MSVPLRLCVFIRLTRGKEGPVKGRAGGLRKGQGPPVNGRQEERRPATKDRNLGLPTKTKVLP